MGLFPSLDYKGLYNSLIPLIEVAPLIQYGLHGIIFLVFVSVKLTILFFSFRTGYSAMFGVSFTFFGT